VHLTAALVLDSRTYEVPAQHERFQNTVLPGNVGEMLWEGVVVGPTWLAYATKQQRCVDLSHSQESPRSVSSGHTAERQRALCTVKILGSGGSNAGATKALLRGGTVAC